MFSITKYIKIDNFTKEYIFQEAVNTYASLNATVLLTEDATENNYIIENYLTLAKNGIWLAIYEYFKNETNLNYYTNQSLSFSYIILEKSFE